MAPPSGNDSLSVRRAYFRDRRSRHFGDRGMIAIWVILGTVVSWLFIAGFTGLGH